MKSLLSIFTVLLFTLPSHISAQTIYYVDDDAAGNNDGSSWANAYTDLNDALASATGSDQIWIAAGIYTPGASSGSQFTINGSQDGLKIYGGFAGTETAVEQRGIAANETILSGDVDNNDLAYAPNTDSDSDANTFSQTDHIRGSNAEVILGFQGSAGSITTATLIDGLTFTGADGESAINAFNAKAAPYINQVTFRANRGENGPAYYGAAFGSDELVKITHSHFESNASNGGLFGGGAVLLSLLNPNDDQGASYAEISYTSFYNNIATTNGGALAFNSNLNGNVDLRLNNLKFAGNTVDPQTNISSLNWQTESGPNGGAINITDFANGKITIINSSFTGNTAPQGAGGALYKYSFSGATLTFLINCTVTENTSKFAAGGLAYGTRGIRLANNVIWGNNSSMTNFDNLLRFDARGPNDEFIPVETINNLVEGTVYNPSDAVLSGNVVRGFELPGNLDGRDSNNDPLFVDVDGPDNILGTMDDNVHVAPNSPLIDAGRNFIYTIPQDGGYYTGEGYTISEDIYGNPRLQGGSVDIGAAEHTYNYTEPEESLPNGVLNFIEEYQTSALAYHSDIYENLGAITIEGWFRTSKASQRQGLVAKDSSFFIDLRPELTFVVTTSDGRERAAKSTTTFSNFVWYHFAVTYDGTDVTIYINGEDVTGPQLLPGSGTIKNTENPILIGMLPFTSAFFHGNFDDLRIWNDLRTPEEIRQHMYQPLSGSEPGLMAYYPFNETGGKILINKANSNEYGGMDLGVERNKTIAPPSGTFITGNEGWRMMTAPVSGESYGDLLDPLWTQGFTGADAENGSSNIYTWDESAQTFTSITDASDVPAAGSGFITYVYSDDDYDGTADGFPKKIAPSTRARHGSVSPALSYNDTGSPTNDGWNLVGNPYGATIDWDVSDGLTTKNLDATFYIWNAEAAEYQSWNGFSGTTALSDGLIAPWQGFWVKANATDPEITFTDNLRSAGGVFRKEVPAPELRFTIKDDNRSNSTVVMLSDLASLSKDRLDAYKLESLNADYLSLFTQTKNGTALDINALPSTATDAPMEVALDVDGSNLEGSFELSWSMSAMPEGWFFLLTDNETGQQVDMSSQSAIEIEFAGSQSSKLSNASQNAKEAKPESPQHRVIAPKVMKTAGGTVSRFTLHIKTKQAVVNERLADIPETFELRQNYPNPFNPTTNIEYGMPETGQVTLEVFDLLGRKVATLINRQTKQAGRYSVQFDAGNMASGLYLYRLEAANTILTKKLTLIK